MNTELSPFETGGHNSKSASTLDRNMPLYIRLPLDTC